MSMNIETIHNESGIAVQQFVPNFVPVSTAAPTVSVRIDSLRGHPLDWACATITSPQWFEDGLMDGDPAYMLDMDDGEAYSPSNNAAQMESIINEHIAKIQRTDGGWLAVNIDGFGFFDQSFLVACARAFVFRHYGPNVDVPEALLATSEVF